VTIVELIQTGPVQWLMGVTAGACGFYSLHSWRERQRVRYCHELLHRCGETGRVISREHFEQDGEEAVRITREANEACVRRWQHICTRM